MLTPPPLSHTRVATQQSGRSDVDQAPQYMKRNCLWIPESNPMRRLFLFIILHENFERTIMGFIMINCITLAIAPPFAKCCGPDNMALGNFTDDCGIAR